MPEAMIMPKAGMTMKTGIILAWRVPEGTPVAKGDVVAEIETDKATMELESEFSGTLLRHLYPAGSVVPVVTPIAWIGSPGDTIPEIPPIPAIEHVKTSLEGLACKLPGSRERQIASLSGVRATPAARRTAIEHHIDLKNITPTGIYGELRLRDIPEPASQANGELIPLTPIEHETGARLLHSWQQIPAVTYHGEADVTSLLKLLERLKAGSGHQQAVPGITLNDLLIAIVARVLNSHPRVNAHMIDGSLYTMPHISVGYAVATDRGLIVPVIHDTPSLSLGTLSETTKRLTSASRDGSIRRSDLERGTFTVTNLGMFGVTSFTPIINPPQTAILGVGAVQRRLVVPEDTANPSTPVPALTTSAIMGLSLTCDHRAIDGAIAARFLADVRQGLEHPASLL